MRGDEETRVVGRDEGLRAVPYVERGEQLGYAAMAVESMAIAVRDDSVVHPRRVQKANRSSCNCSGGKPDLCRDERTAVIRPGGPQM